MSVRFDPRSPENQKFRPAGRSEAEIEEEEAEEWSGRFACKPDPASSSASGFDQPTL